MGKEFGGRPISASAHSSAQSGRLARTTPWGPLTPERALGCLLYTSDAADERSSGDLGGGRIIKKKKNE